MVVQRWFAPWTDLFCWLCPFWPDRGLHSCSLYALHEGHNFLCVFIVCVLHMSVCVLNLSFSYFQAVDSEAERLSTFFSRNSYISGKYVDGSSFANLHTHLLSLKGGAEANRLFYLALPPNVYHDVTENIRHNCMSTKWEATTSVCFMRFILWCKLFLHEP